MIVDGRAKDDFKTTYRDFAEKALFVVHQVMGDAGFARAMFARLEFHVDHVGATDGAKVFVVGRGAFRIGLVGHLRRQMLDEKLGLLDFRRRDVFGEIVE